MTTPTRQKTKSARVEARLAPEVLDLMKRAAELQGRSVSDFMIAAAAEAARKAIAEIEIMYLSREATEQITELLENPPEPTEALIKAVGHRRRLIRG